MLYVLKSPSGHLVEETVATSSSEAWGKAFDFISATNKEFEERYWHKWDASRRAAKKRGWVIVPATLTANAEVTGRPLAARPVDCRVRRHGENDETLD